jgi:hypothetical protein
MRTIDGIANTHPGPRSQAIHWVAWKRLPADALEKHILELLRQAGKGTHFNEHQWRGLDGMRRRLKLLRACEEHILSAG